MRDIGAFREATALWRQTDDDLLAVQRLVAELQSAHAEGTPPVADRDRYLQQLRDLDRRLQVQAQSFPERCCAWPRWCGSPRSWLVGCRCLDRLMAVAPRAASART